MFKKILVPIDIADATSPNATLELAIQLAKNHGSQLILFYVIEHLPGYVTSQIPADVQETIVSDAVVKLEQIAADHGIGDTAEIVVREGHHYRSILDYADQIACDLIVIASHDPDITDYLLGSVAARVVRHAHCSVLVTRKLEG